MKHVNLVPGIQDKVIISAIISTDSQYKKDVIDYYQLTKSNINNRWR